MPGSPKPPCPPCPPNNCPRLGIGSPPNPNPPRGLPPPPWPEACFIVNDKTIKPILSCRMKRTMSQSQDKVTSLVDQTN